MNKYLFFFLLLGILSFSACSTGGSLQSVSPDGLTNVQIQAPNAHFPFDPLSVEIKVKNASFEKVMKLELMITNLNDATCKIEWISNHQAFITFQEKDETQKRVELISNPLYLRLRVMGEKE